MFALLLLFGVLAAIFGVLGFSAPPSSLWTGAQVLFWIFLGLFVLSIFGQLSSHRRHERWRW